MNCLFYDILINGSCP